LPLHLSSLAYENPDQVRVYYVKLPHILSPNPNLSHYPT